MNSNNKKRSLEISSTAINNINENGIEKTFNDKYNEFINKDYGTFEYREIEKYAEELGISNKGRKYEIYNRIEQYLLSQISIIKEIRESEEINPFNKGVIPLLIKEIDNTERLFWSIFRNKPIFKEIFSNFKYKRSFTYERLYDIDCILSKYSNGLKILKDKIKCNSHLNTSFQVISKVLRKDTTENRELLNQFFQKYSKSIDIQDIVEKSIANQNLFLLKYLKVNGEMLNGLSHFITYKGNYRSLKTINYLNELGMDYKVSKHDLFTGNFSIFSDFKLKHLIYFIDKLPIFVKLNEDELNLYNNFKSSISKFNISFTNQQLHSTIFQLLCHQSEVLIKDENTTNNGGVGSIDKSNIESLKSNIFKYVDLLHQIYLNQSDQTAYLLLFKDINQIKSNIVSNTLKASHFFKFFKLKKNMHYDLISYINANSTSNNYSGFKRLIFKSKNIELIQLAFEKYGSIFKNTKFRRDHIDLEVYSIEFLDFFFENYQDSTDLFQDNNYYYLNVKDLPTLLHYEKLMIKLGRKFKTGFSHISHGLHRLQIYTREIYNPDAYTARRRCFLMECIDTWKPFKLEYLFSFLETGYANSIRMGSIENINILNLLLENHLNSPITTIDQIFDCEDSIYRIRFYPHIKREDYESTNKEQMNLVGNLEKNRNILIKVEIKYLFKFLYINGRYEEIFQINNSNDWIFARFHDYSREICSKNCFSKEFVDLLFSHGFKDGKIVNQKFNPKNIIDIIIAGNQLPIFKLITLKYKFLFNQKSKLNPDAPFDEIQLKDFLKNAIINDCVEIAELLLNYTNITINEFYSIKSKGHTFFKHLYDKFK